MVTFTMVPGIRLLGTITTAVKLVQAKCTSAVTCIISCTCICDGVLSQKTTPHKGCCGLFIYLNKVVWVLLSDYIKHQEDALAQYSELMMACVQVIYFAGISLFSIKFKFASEIQYILQTKSQEKENEGRMTRTWWWEWQATDITTDSRSTNIFVMIWYAWYPSSSSSTNATWLQYKHAAMPGAATTMYWVPTWFLECKFFSQIIMCAKITSNFTIFYRTGLYIKLAWKPHNNHTLLNCSTHVVLLIPFLMSWTGFMTKCIFLVG